MGAVSKLSPGVGLKKSYLTFWVVLLSFQNWFSDRISSGGRRVPLSQ